MIPIVCRADWGAAPWQGKTYTVPTRERTEILIHYNGPATAVQTGMSVPRTVDRIHREKGWAGVGYNFLVDMAGTVYEGRGWDLQGAHCPGHNRSGYGLYVAVGGTQVPTAAALRSVRALCDAASSRTGRNLARTWHGACYPTDCPGQHLTAWMQAGMPVASDSSAAHPSREETPMALSDSDIRRIADILLSTDARYQVHDDPDGDGTTELVSLTDAMSRTLMLLREINRRLAAMMAQATAVE